MKIKHGKNIKIFTCDVRNLPNNFVDLASRSYNNYGVFYITGIYSRNEVKELRSNIDTLYKEDGNKRRRFVADISDVVLKKKLSKIFIHPSLLNLMSDIFSNSDVTLLPRFEVAKNYLPHSLETSVQGWHRDCGGEEGIKQCKSILSNKEYVFGKIGLYLQDNSEYGGAIDIIPGSNKDYFGMFKTWRYSKFWILVLSFLQKFINPLYKATANTKLANYLLGAKTVNLKAGDIVIFDSRIWHKGTPARTDIENGLLYHHDVLQADLPNEKTKYVMYSQFGNSLGIKSYFIDRLNRDGNSNEIDDWINDAASLNKSVDSVHDFLKKRVSLFDGTFKDIFGLHKL